jgi:hypothetical protein
MVGPHGRPCGHPIAQNLSQLGQESFQP